METRLNLRGKVIPAVPVPFTERGGIDYPAQDQYIKWMSQQKVGGVAVWAHTGRGLRLDGPQRSDVLNAWIEGMGSTPIICGVGLPQDGQDGEERRPLPPPALARANFITKQTVWWAKVAKNIGAAAVMVHPPAAMAKMRYPIRRIVELHQAVADVGLPVIAFYLYEAASGLAYSAEMVEAILKVPGVIGIKLATLDSVMSFQDLVAVIRGIPDRLIITGEDRFLGYSLMMGADAALIGMAAACTDVIVDLLDAWFAGDLARFKKQSERVDRFGAETFSVPMEGYVQRMLWALQADGVLDGPALDPFAPTLPASERDRVRQAVAALRAR